ncbi:Flp1 family type IVb pilin [Cuneatibacter caecimuris]|uniref:Putative flagellin with Flp1-like domain n=1 Tax=Cuneatibacter caecimuris TaxID=1796618 RepID=A0A4Q7PIL5_9FIRM|nr:Flp1 family type IVb pilin [Cuneatibacter caecimuris]RZT00427.1 putative flagellin with Flp1-like domain [Cuneatibacter caecimuris]
MGNTIRDFFEDESGVGVVEVILILVVLIGLVLIFKNQLIQLVKNIFGQINDSATDVY